MWGRTRRREGTTTGGRRGGKVWRSTPPEAPRMSKTAERQGRQQEVVKEIAESSFGRQAFAGPFVNFPYVEEYEQEVTEEKKDKTVTRIEQRRIRRTATFFPASTGLVATGTVETKSRGLFKARVFNWQASARGEFVLDGKFAFAHARKGSRITVGKPF